MLTSVCSAAIRSLVHSYLIRDKGRVIERPQHMYMRVALATHQEDLPKVLETYEALSRHQFTFATPVLANAGTVHRHYASCYLYIPDARGPEELMQCVHDLDLLWLADGGVGLSLAEVGCRRWVFCLSLVTSGG